MKSLYSILSHERGEVMRMSSKGYTSGQTWGALKKAWKGYKIAKVQSDKAKMNEYAKRIRTLQDELKVAKAKFPELGLE